MRNPIPRPVECALCRTERAEAFDVGRGWVHSAGMLFFLCTECLDSRSPSVVMEAGLHGHPFWHTAPTFCGKPTLQDLERRIEALERNQT